MGRRWLVATAVASALVVSQIPRLGSLAPAVMAVALVLGNVGLVRWRGARTVGQDRGASTFAGPIGACWLLVALLPNHTFSHRPVTASGPALDTESLLQVLGCGVAAVVAAATVRALEPTLQRSRPPVVLVLLPLWTMASCTWSDTGAYAFVRGAQLVSVALLAWATIAVGRADPPSLDVVIEVVLRWFVRIAVLLVGLGVLFGPKFVSASEANLERFTWVGAHPLSAGLILSVALLVACTTSSRTLGVPPWGRLGFVLVFLGALIPNHSRQAWLALSITLILGLLLGGNVPPTVRSVVGPLAGAVAAAGVLFRGSELWDYLLRSEDSQTLSTGNGRLDLWDIGFRALDTPMDWLIGLGHGITRTVFVAEAPWARSAHSSILGALVSLGVVGLVLLIVVLATACRHVISTRMWRTHEHGLFLTLLLAFLAVNGLAGDNLIIPNLGFSGLCLVASVAMAHRHTVGQGPELAHSPLMVRDTVR